MATIIDRSGVYSGTNEADDFIILSNADVNGERGDDRLTVNFFAFGTTTASFGVQLYGASGDDELFVFAGLDGHAGGDLFPQLRGGKGDDILWVDLISRDSDQEVIADGEDGDDDITILSTLPAGTKRGHDESITARGGDGDDNVAVHVTKADHGGPQTSNDLKIQGGAGDDTLTASYVGARDYPIIEITDIAYGGQSGGDNVVSVISDIGHGWAGANIRLAAQDDDGGLLGKQGNNKVDVDAKTDDGSAQAYVLGGGGVDRITSSLTATSVGDAVYARSHLVGNGGDDRISGSILLVGPLAEAINRISGGVGDDRLSASIELSGMGSADARSLLWGGAGDDWLSVRGGADNVLDGGSGADTLTGGVGADEIRGGIGADVLVGRGGSDTFVFETTRDARDEIRDFARGEDRIDLSAIDADPARKGNQSFVFGAGKGDGRVWVAEDPHGDGSLVYADNGADILVILLADGRQPARGYTASDFDL